MLANFRRVLRRQLSSEQLQALRRSLAPVRRAFGVPQYLYAKSVTTPLNLRRNSRKQQRWLDIGPGAERIAGFETINVVPGPDVDYVGDATKRLPFADNTFDLVHASHVLEHTPWDELRRTLHEWARVLKPGGTLEVWVPDGYKLASFLVDIERGVERKEWEDGWRPLAVCNDPFYWVNGRILYGVRKDYPSWHTAIITPGFLRNLFAEQGFRDITQLADTDARGTRHGWINLGMRGIKP